ncbi:hypothetical protein TNCV_2979551 [Trichonephila clavipes]|nr:hypothetical protein TNCV_2979551 [Trichonephila clavipes]
MPGGRHRVSFDQVVHDGGHRQRNETTLRLLTNPSSVCNITMVGFEFGDTVVICQTNVAVISLVLLVVAFYVANRVSCIF